MPRSILDTETSFPKTVYEAIRNLKIRGTIRDEMSNDAPSQKLKFRSIMVTLYGSHQPEFGLQFGFVYCRHFQQYFLFVESNPSASCQQSSALMHIFLIIKNELLWLNKNNIILGSPVFDPPKDDTALSYGMIPRDTEWSWFRHSLNEFCPKVVTQVSFDDDNDEAVDDEVPTIDGLIDSMQYYWRDFLMIHGVKTSD